MSELLPQHGQDNEAAVCPNYSLILSRIDGSPIFSAFQTSAYLALSQEIEASDDRTTVPDEFRNDLSGRIENAWLFFEADEHEYRFPRKIAKYIANLAQIEDCSPASIQRANNYFDSNEMFREPLFRLEANLELVSRSKNQETTNSLAAHNIAYLEELSSVAEQRITAYVKDNSLEHPFNFYGRIDNLVALELQGARHTGSTAIIDTVMESIQERYTPLLEVLFKNDTQECESQISLLFRYCAETSREIGYTDGFEAAVSNISAEHILDEVLNPLEPSKY